MISSRSFPHLLFTHPWVSPECIEYQEKYVYPCLKSVALTGKKARANRCKHDAKDLIVGGVAASEDEFPHMVRLLLLPTYRNSLNTRRRSCTLALRT